MTLGDIVAALDGHMHLIVLLGTAALVAGGILLALRVRIRRAYRARHMRGPLPRCLRPSPETRTASQRMPGPVERRSTSEAA